MRRGRALCVVRRGWCVGVMSGAWRVVRRGFFFLKESIRKNGR